MRCASTKPNGARVLDGGVRRVALAQPVDETHVVRRRQHGVGAEGHSELAQLDLLAPALRLW